MKKIIINSIIIWLTFSTLANQPDVKQPAAINYSGFLQLSVEVSKHREKHLVDLDTFQKMSLDENTIILNTRSLSMFNNRHISGAVHLNFSDFTQDKLEKLIPNKNTRVLIYCNNNFTDDPAFFALKMRPLALNIPTYINLYGYGYKNVYELNESVSVKDQRLKFSGTFKNAQTIKLANFASSPSAPQ